MYILFDKPNSRNTAWEALDNAFGTERFSKEDAVSALVRAGVGNEYEAFARLVRDGYATEVD